MLLNKLLDRQIVVGTWFTIPSAHLCDVVCASNLDFVILDREHGPSSFETIQTCIMAAKSRGVGSLIRPKDFSVNEILSCMDCNADGLQIPNVTNLEDVEICIDRMNYYPDGSRGLSIFTKSGDYGALPVQNVFKKERTKSLVLNLENKEILDDLDKIVELSQVHALFIGLYDLSKSFGCPGNFENHEIRSWIKEVTDICNRAGKSVGTIVHDTETAQDYIRNGMNYIIYSVDTNIIRNAYNDFTVSVKQ